MKAVVFLVALGLAACADERLAQDEFVPRHYKYQLGELIPGRPRMGEGDIPYCYVPESKFYVYILAPGLPKLCAFEECGPGGDRVARLGGFLLGDGEYAQDDPVNAEGAYVLVANEKARIIGVYPRCTVADLPMILPLHPETGALAEPVPKRLAWNASCRPDLAVAPLSASEMWRSALRTKGQFALNGKIHRTMLDAQPNCADGNAGT